MLLTAKCSCTKTKADFDEADDKVFGICGHICLLDDNWRIWLTQRGIRVRQQATVAGCEQTPWPMLCAAWWCQRRKQLALNPRQLTLEYWDGWVLTTTLTRYIHMLLLLLLLLNVFDAAPVCRHVTTTFTYLTASQQAFQPQGQQWCHRRA